MGIYGIAWDFMVRQGKNMGLTPCILKYVIISMAYVFGKFDGLCVKKNH